RCSLLRPSQGHAVPGGTILRGQRQRKRRSHLDNLSAGLSLVAARRRYGCKREAGHRVDKGAFYSWPCFFTAMDMPQQYFQYFNENRIFYGSKKERTSPFDYR